MKSHKDLYKGKTLQNERSHRNRVNVELRREMRDDIISKRRILMSETTADKQQVVDISHLVPKFYSINPEEIFSATETLRGVLNSDQNQLYQKVVDAGLVKQLVSILSLEQIPIKINAIIILSNLADALPKQVPSLVEYGLVDILAALLESSRDMSLLDSVLQALFNILDHFDKIAALLQNLPIVNSLLVLLESPETNADIKARVLALLHLIVKDSKIIRTLSGRLAKIVQLFKILLGSDDIRILSQCIWILAAFCDNSEKNTDIIVLDEILLKGILQLSEAMPVSKMINPVIRLFGNISAGNDDKTQLILDIGCLNTLSAFKGMEENKIKKEFLWFVSNIAAGTYNQAKMLYDFGLHEYIYSCFQNGTLNIRKEALWVISNLLFNAKDSDVLETGEYWVSCGLIPTLGQLLTQTTDNEMIKLCIECFTFLFQNCSRQSEAIQSQIDSCGALDAINDIFSNPSVSDEILQLTEDLIDSFLKDNLSSDYPEYTNEMSFDF